MLKRKILLLIALYIILGIIAFFNFGFHRYLAGKSELKITTRYNAREYLDEGIQNPQTEDIKESPDPPSDMGKNN